MPPAPPRSRRFRQEEWRIGELYRAAYRAGDEEAQLAAMEIARELDPAKMDGPNLHWQYTSRIRLLKKLGRDDEALAVLRRGAAVEALHADAWSQAHLAEVALDLDPALAAELADRAAAILEAEARDGPKDEWDRYLRAAPIRSQPCMHLAAVRAAQGRYAEAAAAQREAVALVPAEDYPDHAANLRAALKMYEEMAAANPADPGR